MYCYLKTKGNSFVREMSTLNQNFLLVAAIDFGTAYSGYAFSSKEDFKTDPLKISANTWIGGTLMSLKTSTCVLFDKEKKFYKFGYDAEDAYANLALDDKHNDYYYFRRFKMELFNKLKLKRRFMLEDVMGKKMLAMDVFSACIKFLKDDLMTKVCLQLPDADETDIRWVLTVPAIWNDVSKQFMREAAEKAGIANESLLMALEPEAASLCCRYSSMTSLKGSQKFMPFQPGTKYLIFDAGGGTVDITVHEVLQGGGLKELYAANGGDWGGTYVDRAFRVLLADIVGNDIITELETTHTSDYIDIFREFETMKRKFSVSMADKITFKVPIALNDLFKAKHGKDIKEHLRSLPKFQDKITWISDKLRMDAEVAKGLFKEACTSAASHLEALFMRAEVKDVDTVLMVGGFSESPMLQKYVQDAVPSSKKFIIPNEAGLAVLKGAVIFGHSPLVIKERRSRYTYGVRSSIPFQVGKHPESKKFRSDDGNDYCSDIFDVHVKIGQELVVGDTNVVEKYTPVKTKQQQMTFRFYASTDRDPTFTTDGNCTDIGQLTVDLAGSGTDRSVSVKMIFGDTELHVEAVETATGKRSECSLNFLV
ncbi:heat shock 70 kDa protein 12A-like isoform X2 [Dreissena polymorpha]|uniref:heat shock 70 kDa protein 12A-like isoform X2 n=1 Tax=Dreissena polymorpha TaxID=45954 RepID=UPI0022656279|nr:heat shock 70 kDa protein 12A-like isoform X2 [Dreissena polymorpha]